MSSTNELEKLYSERVKADKALKSDFQGLIKYVVDTVICRMMAQSPEFKAIYSKALFDDFKEASSEEEFDLNIVLCDSLEGEQEALNSPNKFFDLLRVAVSQVLTDKGLELMYEGRTYLVTQKAPATLVIAVINGSRSCKVNLVPTFKLIRSMISRDQQQKVNNVCQQFGMCLPSPCYSSSFYMATALPDKLMFDLSEVEEWLVRSGDCLKKVIKLMEHMKKVKGSPLIKLSTRLLKVSSDGS